MSALHVATVHVLFHDPLGRTLATSYSSWGAATDLTLDADSALLHVLGRDSSPEDVRAVTASCSVRERDWLNAQLADLQVEELAA